MAGVTVRVAAAGATPAARARAGWRARVSRAHVVIALAGVLGALLTLAAVHAASHAVPVLEVARDIGAGQRIEPGDVDVVAVHASSSVLARLVRSEDRAVAVGRVATHELRAGELLRDSDLQRTAAANGARAMSFAVDASDALDGRVSRGDRIDVVAVDRDGTNAGYVLVDASVLEVSSDAGSGPLRDAHGRVTVTVAIDERDALRLAAAQAAAHVTVIRSTGARRIGPVPRYEPKTTDGAHG